jgi:Methyltransferase domain
MNKSQNIKSATQQVRDALIAPHQSVELLKALHVLTRDGVLNQDSRRKLKQIAHLFQFVQPLLQPIKDARGRVDLVDHGAGKSYLGFILYDLFFAPLNDDSRVFSVETRAELVEKSAALARQLGFSGMHFEHISAADAITSSALPARVDIVTALHACDTATDDAIAFALAKQAQHVVVVPCCQAQVARFLNAGKAKALGATPLAELWRRPLHTREFGSQITNVLRCLQLEAHGFDVTVTELTGWEHSMKNELIIASRNGAPRKAPAARLQAILTELGLENLQERFFIPA